MKNVLRNILITVFVTNFLMVVISFNNPGGYWMNETVISQFVNAVILGVIVAIANLLFKLQWPLAYVLGLHYLITMTAVLLLNLGWLSSFKEAFSLYARASIVYFVIWLYYYIDEKRTIQRMNNQLQNRGE